MKNAINEINFKELEIVNGGTANAPDSFYIRCSDNHTVMNASTACEVLRGIYNGYGYDYAVAYAKNYWLPTRDWDNYIHAGGPEYAVQMIWGKCYESAYHLNGIFSGM